MTAIEKRQRNQEINKAFASLYSEARQQYGGISYTGIYYVLAKRFNLSEMQIRRIVKGYPIRT